MTAERPRQGADEGAGIGWAADSTVGQVELFSASRGAYGNVSYTAPSYANAIPAPEGLDDDPSTAATTSRSQQQVVAEAHQRVANTDGGESWLKLAEDRIKVLVLRRQPFTTDDVILAVGEPPNRNLPAVAVKRAKLAGLIHVVGFTNSVRPEARGHGIRVWGPR